MLTKPAKLAVLTNPPGSTVVPVALERYPAVPRPITVDVNCASKKDVLTKPAKLAVLTKPVKLAVLTKPAKLAVLTNPPGSTAVPVALER